MELMNLSNLFFSIIIGFFFFFVKINISLRGRREK